MIEIVLGVVLFTAVVLVLVGIILLARSKLVAAGTVPIVVNEQRTVDAAVGGKLLGALADAELYVSSAWAAARCCPPRPRTSPSARHGPARGSPARWP